MPKSVSIGIYGAWYFFSPKIRNQEDLNKVDEVPGEGWKLVGLEGGRFSEEDVPILRKKKPWWGDANILVLGQGNTADLYYIGKKRESFQGFGRLSW